MISVHGFAVRPIQYSGLDIGIGIRSSREIGGTSDA